MKISAGIKKWLAAVYLSIVFVGSSSAATIGKMPSVDFRSFKVSPTLNKTRLNTVAQAVAFKDWPKTDLLRVAPVIDKSMLSNPQLVTRESITYSHIMFDQEPWGKARWSWDSLVEIDNAVPTVLPPEQEKMLLKRIPSEKQKDPVYVQQYLKRHLNRYQKSQKYRLDGQMYVEICLSPSSHAAQEYLLATMTENMMSTDVLVQMYAHATHPKELGNVSFLIESRQKDDIHVKFVRDNICLNIWANGQLVDEALPLAKKIDAMISEQPVLTYEQVKAKRPSVMIGSEPDQKETVSYDVSVPSGQKIVIISAYIDGKAVGTKEGMIYLSGQKGRVKVKLIAITHELLAGSFERELIVGQ